MTINQLRLIMLSKPPTQLQPIGFTNPHPWRADYTEPAIEPTRPMLPSEILAHLHNLITDTFHGYKGGEYTYTLTDTIHLAFEGNRDDLWADYALRPLDLLMRMGKDND